MPNPLPRVWTDALGESDVFLDFQDTLGLLAKGDRPILIVGERGTGKELAVQRLHYSSARWEKPLVTVLCPAISPMLLESELFGHEAGAFTGARGRRAGYFERADGGTVFLDEVADMPLPLQDKLLRVIEYGVFERVGGVSPVQVDVRILAATNRNLPALAAAGKFREDLLDRLAFDVLHVPPLRARGEDALLLARHFAARMALELDREGEAPSFGPEALRQLKAHPWPGNIRELKNAVERAVLHSRGPVIERLELDPFRSTFPPLAERRQAWTPEPSCPGPKAAFPMGKIAFQEGIPPGFRLSEAVAAYEKQALEVALAQARHRQKDAAALLGLTYHQFRALLKKYK